MEKLHDEEIRSRFTKPDEVLQGNEGDSTRQEGVEEKQTVLKRAVEDAANDILKKEKKKYKMV